MTVVTYIAGLMFMIGIGLVYGWALALSNLCIDEANIRALGGDGDKVRMQPLIKLARQVAIAAAVSMFGGIAFFLLSRLFP
jgi:hypothetical protein